MTDEKETHFVIGQLTSFTLAIEVDRDPLDGADSLATCEADES